MSPHFKGDELSCQHCDVLKFPKSTLDRLERVRVKCGFPFVVSSAYRCPEHNAAVSDTGRDGPHTKGAVDIAISGKHAWTLVKVAMAEGFTGIGIHQKGPHDKRFVHLDDLPDTPEFPRPATWSY